jgi:hypothetical protein
MKIRTIAALGAVAAMIAEPATASPFAADPADHRIGAVAALRLRLPLGPSQRQARLGVTMNAQHRYVTSERGVRRVDIDGLEIAFSRSGPALYAGGSDVGQPTGHRLPAAADDEDKFPWGTIGLVLGGAALLGGAYFLHVIDESEENSE